MDAYKIKLSENFKLYEFLKSGTALRKDIKEQFNPSVEVIENIELLCQRVLQPIRSYLNTPLNQGGKLVPHNQHGLHRTQVRWTGTASQASRCQGR